MEIIHNLGKNLIINKTITEADDASLMLARDGSYLWTGNNFASRYGGWFLCLDDGRLIKIIDNIRPCGYERIDKLINGLDNIKKIGSQIQQIFYLPDKKSLVYELDKFASVEITFDIKDLYESPEFGRNYRISKEDGAVIVNFRQENGSIPEIFVAIWGDFGTIRINEKWIKRNYEFDRMRRDAPWERWVINPVDLQASRIIISAGLAKEEALASAKSIWQSLKREKKAKDPWEQKSIRQSLLPNEDTVDDLGIAKECAANALKMLYIKKTLRAGLPWFFQTWRRDEAVSLNGMAQVDFSAVREIILRQIKELVSCDYHYSDSADAVGWLFLRAADFIRQQKLNKEEIKIIYDALENTIGNLLKRDTVGQLAVNSSKQTWMDSLERSGAPIEIQALRLNMYELASTITASQVKKRYYLKLKQELSGAVREKFLDSYRLADRFDLALQKPDFSLRPNIFLAAYIYPWLLQKKEWIGCFDKALPELWLDWGGLSTIGKNDANFKENDTGVDPVAYHNGDSWFWVNNLAAIALARLDCARYQYYIDKILAASTNDLLWHGAIGCASEISPASNYAPAGCVNQAWSNATFLELCKELEV